MELVLIFGPPAVGKMTVGEQVRARTGFGLLHNHATIEPMLDVFDFDSPPFRRLVDEFRERILQEALASDLPGLVMTFVWDLESPQDAVLVESYARAAEAAAARVSLVELAAALTERLERNGTPLRLDRKRSKRNLTWSRDNVLDHERRHVMNTGGPPVPLAEAVLAGRRHLRVDNTELSPAEVAGTVVSWLSAGGPTAPIA